MAEQIKVAGKKRVEVAEIPARERAKLRPANYADPSAQEQWAIDKRLGILDWDGT
jgi:hypothetical protein